MKEAIAPAVPVQRRRRDEVSSTFTTLGIFFNYKKFLWTNGHQQTEFTDLLGSNISKIFYFMSDVKIVNHAIYRNILMFEFEGSVI